MASDESEERGESWREDSGLAPLVWRSPLRKFSRSAEGAVGSPDNIPDRAGAGGMTIRGGFGAR